MFHVKQLLRDKLARFQELVARYHSSLDLMSPEGVRALPQRIEEGLRYAAAVDEALSPTATIVDVGSGAGLPGIVIAAALASHPVFLAERRRRRAAFLRLAVAELELDNVQVVANDVRELRGVTVAAVTAQWLGSFTRAYCATRHLHADEVVLVMRKGEDWRRELRGLRAALGESEIEAKVEKLAGGGRLVTIRSPGGLVCRSSA